HKRCRSALGKTSHGLASQTWTRCGPYRVRASSSARARCTRAGTSTSSALSVMSCNGQSSRHCNALLHATELHSYGPDEAAGVRLRVIDHAAQCIAIEPEVDDVPPARRARMATRLVAFTEVTEA